MAETPSSPDPLAATKATEVVDDCWWLDGERLEPAFALEIRKQKQQGIEDELVNLSALSPGRAHISYIDASTNQTGYLPVDETTAKMVTTEDGEHKVHFQHKGVVVGLGLAAAGAALGLVKFFGKPKA